MLWVIYSLLSAFTFSTADAFTKKASDGIDRNILTLSRFLYGAPIALLMLFFAQIPRIDAGFWSVMAVIIPLEILAWILYIKAIRESQLSLVAPIISFTPVFLVATSFLIIGELPSLSGLAGILLVASGAYILNFKTLRHGIFDPITSIFREKSSLYMLIVAFLFSITSTLSKITVQKSSAVFSSSAYLLAMSMSFFAISFFKSRSKMPQLKTHAGELAPIGLFYGSMAIFHNMAITLTLVPYMMSIKRTSSIFSVFYGHFWFKEHNMKNRMAGALVMLIGAILIILS